MSERQRERLLAVLAALLALACVVTARAIEDSLLSDAVGAGGVPQGVGIAMGLAALALFVKSFRRAPTPPEVRAGAAADGAGAGFAAPAAAAGAARADAAAEPAPRAAAALGAGATDRNRDNDSARAKALRAGTLVLVLLGYAALLPVAGYLLSISLLVGAVGWLAGAAARPALWLCALLAGPALWLLFHYLLQVRMPVGRLWG